jgi:hypothetical protein
MLVNFGAATEIRLTIQDGTIGCRVWRSKTLDPVLSAASERLVMHKTCVRCRLFLVRASLGDECEQDGEDHEND